MIKQPFLNISQLGKGRWWVEVITSKPFCIYYFGPFSSFQEADRLRPGYVQDLLDEGTNTVQVLVKQCEPANLTIFNEDEVPELLSASSQR